jgi:asparagine synthase (glutamine-hydrolysing)
MIKVELKYDQGFPWHSRDGCHVRGYVLAGKNQYLSGDSLVDYFLQADDYFDFIALLKAADGMFSVILVRDGKAYFAVDRIRALPLFYVISGTNSIVSDAVDRIHEVRGSWELNQHASVEFLATGYVTGRETLSRDICQVQAAEAIYIEPGKIHQRLYDTYQTSGAEQQSYTSLQRGLEGVTEKVFRRLAVSLQGRTAVIALSGGYDSRFIAAMLKRMAYPRVICFTYGREGNPDMVLSGKVAGILGFRWIPVTYTEELVEGYLQDEAFYDYIRYTSNWISMFFMQEYFALKYLKEHQLIPDDAVIIPGHSADFFAGSQFIKHGISAADESLRKISRRIWDIKYNLCKPPRDARRIMMARICRTLMEKRYIDHARSWSVYEDWDLKEKLAKFLVNSCNVYAWFGYEYRLPFYDVTFMDFFRDVPYAYKINKKLYDPFLVDGLFRQYGLNLPREIQPGAGVQRLARIKRKLKKILPEALLPSSPSRQDPIFYYEITRILRDDLAQKGIRTAIRGRSYNSLIVQWYIEYLKQLRTGRA